MASTIESDSAKSLEDILRRYEESTHSHFILKYTDKNFFDESMCLCASSCKIGEIPIMTHLTRDTPLQPCRPVELEMNRDKNRAKLESGSYEAECHP